MISLKKGSSNNFWIQSAVVKEGALSRQLGIPKEKNIPFGLLEKIVKSEIGTTIKNPTKCGRKYYKVTKLMKKRSVLALNLKRIKK